MGGKVKRDSQTRGRMHKLSNRSVEHKFDMKEKKFILRKHPFLRKDLSSSAGLGFLDSSGHVWIRISHQTPCVLDPKPSILHDDDRILHRVIWINPKDALRVYKKQRFHIKSNFEKKIIHIT